MNVLSLFDGKSGAVAALDLLGVKVDNYYACEIDKYSQQVSRYHYPNTIRLGDVTKVTSDDLPKIDLLIAGFPCQAFSFAGKQLNFDDPRGKLFFEVVRLLRELQPKFFLLENVRMKKDIEAEINKLVGVQPILINSARLGSQNRLRNYWCGGYKDGKVYQVNIMQPEDKGIFLKDIIEDGLSDRDKLTTNKGEGIKVTGGAMRGRYLDKTGKRLDSTVGSQAGLTEQRIEVRSDGKSNCLSTVQKDSLAIYQRPRGFNKGKLFIDKSPTLSSNSWQDNNYLCLRIGTALDVNGFDANKRIYSPGGKSPTLLSNSGSCREPKVAVSERHYRKLTPLECERLQNYPDNYTAMGVDDKGNQVKVSNSQRYKMLGNGFDRFTVAHCLEQILKGINDE